MKITEVPNHRPRRAGDVVLQRIRALKIGQRMQDLPEELWHRSFRYYVKEDPTRAGGPNLRLIRLDPNQPSLTVTGYIYNKFVHPFEDRFITPREAARLQGFPDDLEFYGSLISVQQQIGDAVPVELGTAAFRSLSSIAKDLWGNTAPLNAISLFSGAGGLEVAAKRVTQQAGVVWQTLACIELEKDRCITLQNYFGETLVVMRSDIRTVCPQQLVSQLGVTPSDIHLIYGGPPCQSFSQAGKQKGTHDTRGELVFEFVRFLQELSPPLFLLENVPNLKSIDRGKLLASLLSKLNDLDYRVSYGILNAAYYGTAQKRRRLIMLGAKKHLKASLELPEPTHGEEGNLLGLLPLKTVSEAFQGLPPID